jgi:ubiquinone/menaquinone biosynthesis C-methylase UbiE
MKNYLTKNRLFLLLNVFLITNVLGTIEENNIIEKTFDAVGHKNSELNLYLDFIRYNTHEKVGILPYILQKNKGVYLEIGTGGDPIMELFSKLPETSDITIFASDVEENVLNMLLVRNPSLKKYLGAKKGPKLRLQQLDATRMHCFENNSLDGINASAVVHEIISYAGGFSGMKSFFNESFRVLKPDGILVYRDPESVPNKEKQVVMRLKNKNIRLFAHIVIYKLLDSRGSNLAQSGRKFKLYDPKDVQFAVFKKNALEPSNMTYEEYLYCPSYDIDFSREYTLKLPHGLYRELSRHYLTYLHQCNPLVFVNLIPNIFGQYKINYLAHSTNELFAKLLANHNLSYPDNGIINTMEKFILDKEIDSKSIVLEFGIPLHFSSQLARCKLRDLLEKNNFNPSNHIISLSKEDCLLDYRVFGMLYDSIKQEIFDNFNHIVNKHDEEHAKWLKREGEEFYFYLSDDELITEVLQITLAKDFDDHGNKKFFVLCPLSKDHNKFIDRICYTEMLKSAIELSDEFGYEVPIIDGKRIIHFSKITAKNAISICKEIIQTDPIRYQKLEKYICTLEDIVAKEEYE